MKIKILFLIIVLGMNANAQSSATVFPKANTITILSDNKTLFDQFTTFLKDHGYTISIADSEKGNLQTNEFKLWKSSNQTGKIIVIKREGYLMITGDASAQSLGFKSVDKMEKRGTGNMSGKLFDIVDKLCRSFVSENAYSISYSKL